VTKIVNKGPTTPNGPIRPSDTRPRLSLPPNSPQWAIGFAHVKRCAGRPLLRRRNRAKFNRQLWPQLGEYWGSQHCRCRRVRVWTVGMGDKFLKLKDSAKKATLKKKF